MDHSWIYHCTVKDIDVHRGVALLDCDNPQDKWQEHGLSINRVAPGELNVGDKLDVQFVIQGYGGLYRIVERYPTDTPGKPTYEIVDEGRWYDKYLCCSKAYKADVFCVCNVRIACPVHTNNSPMCIGSHD